MARYKALISCPLIRDSIDQYDDAFADHDIEYDIAAVEQQLTEDQLLNVIDEYDAILAGDDELTGRVLREADRLKVISKWGIGTDSIDSEVAEEEGIEVLNTPGVFDDEVADVVVGYAIMLTRRLHEIDSAVREGTWHCPRGTSLAGKTLGVVGVGNIGSAVVRRGAALGMDVVGYDVVPFDEELVADTGLESVSVSELFERADLVSLNCPLTPETREMVDEEALERLGPDGYLINASRGQLVDEEALVDALRSGEIAGAALDVFQNEPLDSNSPLTDIDNVILGSHNAQNTTEAVERTNTKAVENLIKALQPAEQELA